MSKIVETAMKEVGTTEVPANSNKTKYGVWFGFDGVAWCAMFVSWCYAMADFPLPNIGFKKGFAGCQTGYAYFKKMGWITDEPVPGDIVLFDWNGDKRYDHTGIFVEWITNISFKTVEGNTAIGNDSNGGKVMIRERQKGKAVFVHVPL
jgi:hypothetical protein